MTAIYVILKICLLMAVIIVPLFKRTAKPAVGESGLSQLAVNEGGYLVRAQPDAFQQSLVR